MSKTKERIQFSQLQYKKGLGQNFIYDEALNRELAEISGVTSECDVLEIGPGSGELTKCLCRLAHHVTSIELDERLIPLLHVAMEKFDNFTLIQGDCLKLDIPEILSSFTRPVYVVANIPYYITSPIINLFLDIIGKSGKNQPIVRMAFMVQHEVCGKILAMPGDSDWGMLGLRCQYFCQPSEGRFVPREFFTPAPNVDSDFVVLDVRDVPLVQPISQSDFFRVASSAFALRRKTMVNNLCATFRLERQQAVELMAECGLDEKIRGERLTLPQLCALSDAYTRLEENQNGDC